MSAYIVITEINAVPVKPRITCICETVGSAQNMIVSPAYELKKKHGYITVNPSQDLLDQLNNCVPLID